MEQNWKSRQSAMEDWYRSFSADLDSAARNLLYDYEPYIPVLQEFQGAVLDVGGGAGLAAIFLPTASEYVVLEPSPLWKDSSWSEITARVGRPRTPTRFVKGVGENMPFPDGRFDAALAFWSLNHADDPQKVLTEMHRVLKSGSRAFIVLEDVEPAVMDVMRYLARAVLCRARVFGKPSVPLRKPYPLSKLIKHKLSRQPWPVQDDHVRITEQDFKRWTGDRFIVDQRSWAGGFLSYRLVRV